MKQIIILCLFLLCISSVKASHNSYQIYFYDENKQPIISGKVKLTSHHDENIYTINQGMIELNNVKSDYYKIQLLIKPYQEDIKTIYINENKQMKCNLYYHKQNIIKETNEMIIFYRIGIVLLIHILGIIYLHNQIKNHS